MVQRILLVIALALAVFTAGFITASTLGRKQNMDLQQRADAINQANHRLEITIADMSNQFVFITGTVNRLQQSNRKLREQYSNITVSSGIINESISNASISASGIEQLLDTIQDRSRE